VWRLEADPEFTRDVVARGLLRTPFTLLDVGSRGGIAEQWRVFGDRLRELAVEPDPDEPGISAVLAAEPGTARFFHRPYPATDGLYRMDELYEGTVIEPIAEPVGSETVPTTTLLELFGAETLGAVDFVKLDVEFAELDVLRGAGPLLGAALAIELEVHFPKRPRDAGCFAEVDLFLQEHGYELYDLEPYRYSRPDFPSPRLYDYRAADGTVDPLGASVEGQILTGDALYVTTRVPADPDRILKLACIFELHRLRDCAVDLLERSTVEVPGDPGLLRREHDALVDADGGRWGPNFHVFEDLWAQRWPEYPAPRPEPEPPLPPRFRDALRDMLRRRFARLF
jgi:FkbM family methyltransferase